MGHELQIQTDAETGLRFVEQAWSAGSTEIKLEAVEDDHATLDVTASVTTVDELDALMEMLAARRNDLITARQAMGLQN